jgi:predicted transcriptional regulator
MQLPEFEAGQKAVADLEREFAKFEEAHAEALATIRDPEKVEALKEQVAGMKEKMEELKDFNVLIEEISVVDTKLVQPLTSVLARELENIGDEAVYVRAMLRNKELVAAEEAAADEFLPEENEQWP